MTTKLFGVGGVVLAAGLAAGLGLASCSSDAPATTATTLHVDATDFATVAPPVTTEPPTTIGPLTPGDKIPTESTYTIVSGDYPSTVATKFQVDLDELISINGWTLKDGKVPEWPGVGKVIKIPADATVPEADGTPVTTPAGGTDGTDGVATATTGEPPPTTVDTCAPTEYKIVAGDVPLTVAKKFDTTVAALDEINSGTPGYGAFQVGITIKIPGKTTDC
jgi:LysM repeat protein